MSPRLQCEHPDAAADRRGAPPAFNPYQPLASLPSNVPRGTSSRMSQHHSPQARMHTSQPHSQATLQHAQIPQSRHRRPVPLKHLPVRWPGAAGDPMAWFHVSTQLAMPVMIAQRPDVWQCCQPEPRAACAQAHAHQPCGNRKACHGMLVHNAPCMCPGTDPLEPIDSRVAQAGYAVAQLMLLSCVTSCQPQLWRCYAAAVSLLAAHGRA